MIINTHQISTAEIIGISPLFIKSVETESVYAEMYGRYKLTFWIYTRSNEIEISSNTLYSRGKGKDGLAKDKEYDLIWRKGYYDAAERIYELTNEPTPWPKEFYENRRSIEEQLKQFADAVESK